MEIISKEDWEKYFNRRNEITLQEYIAYLNDKNFNAIFNATME